MKKQLIGLVLGCAVAIPVFASTAKPFTITNTSDKAMLVATIADKAKIDRTGTVLGIKPLAKANTWSSLITIDRPANLAVVVVEDDGFGLEDIFNENSEMKVVCAVSANQTEDSKSVFADAIITSANSTHHCSISNNGKSLDIN